MARWRAPAERARRAGPRYITIRDCVLHDNGWSGIDLAAVHNDLHPPAGKEDTAYDQGQLFTAAEINDDRYQVGNVSVDPLFIDPDQPDFHLQAGSPLIDAGVDLGLPFCGRAPDIGAYERCP